MPKPKAKGKHNVSALSKAFTTHRHTTPTGGAATGNATYLDIRKAATTAEFRIEDRGLDAGPRACTKTGTKTVLSAETAINIERRIRNAAVPIGSPIDDVANVVEDMSLVGFDTSRVARRLMPRRPAWTFELSSGRLHHREVQAFRQWLDDVRELITERGGYPPAFEQNLQVWRQLWRVLERCDVAVAVVDVRHPLLHLPPTLVYHVMRTLQKPLVVVLNKLDAVRPADAVRWAACLRHGLPGVAGIVGHSKEPLRPDDFEGLEIGHAALIDVCHRAYAAAKAARPADEAATVAPPAAVASDGVPESEPVAPGGDEAPSDAAGADAGAALPLEQEDVAAGRVMLGMVGHPNVGKSSLINSLVGSKVVSVKSTPGHTKTLQTLVLDERTCLCDSPGIVFPRLEVPRETQIVGMLIPIAQVREPFSALRWVMERVTQPLDELVNVKKPTLQQVLDFHETGTEVLRLDLVQCDEDGPVPWSPMLLCAQYAVQRGFTKGGRPDCGQAGMEILQRVLEGRIPYSVPPPESFQHWEDAPHGSTSDTDSDWQVDDDDYDSAAEQEVPAAGLLEAFGMSAKTAGSGSIKSRKKQERAKRREALEKGTDAQQAPASTWPEDADDQ